MLLLRALLLTILHIFHQQLIGNLNQDTHDAQVNHVELNTNPKIWTKCKRAFMPSSSCNMQLDRNQQTSNTMSPLLQWWQAEIHSSQCEQQHSELHYTNITPQWKMHLCKMLLLEHEMASFTIRVFGNDAEQQCSFDLTIARNKTTAFSPISNPYHHQHGSFLPLHAASNSLTTNTICI